MEIPKGLAVRRMDQPMFTFRCESGCFFQFHNNFKEYYALLNTITPYNSYLLAPKCLSNWSK